MTNLLQELLDKAAKDRRLLTALKDTAVLGQQFELASQLRELERKAFPENEQIAARRANARKFATALGMGTISVNEPTALLILSIAEGFAAKGGELTLDEVTDMRLEQSAIYPHYHTPNRDNQ